MPSPHGCGRDKRRVRLPSPSVLFITGYAGDHLPPDVEVVGKPFTLDELARRAQTLLAAARPEPDRDPGA